MCWGRLLTLRDHPHHAAHHAAAAGLLLLGGGGGSCLEEGERERCNRRVSSEQKRARGEDEGRRWKKVFCFLADDERPSATVVWGYAPEREAAARGGGAARRGAAKGRGGGGQTRVSDEERSIPLESTRGTWTIGGSNAGVWRGGEVETRTRAGTATSTTTSHVYIGLLGFKLSRSARKSVGSFGRCFRFAFSSCISFLAQDPHPRVQKLFFFTILKRTRERPRGRSQ